MEKNSTTTKAVTVFIPAGLEKLAELVHKTEKARPKSEDVQALRSYLEGHPELWRILGDVSKFAYTRLIDATVGDQVPLRESLMVGREAMREELGYHQASPLERLLIDQVLLCWLRLHNVELNHTAVMDQNRTLAVADHWDRKLSAAQRRYLRACETLARIRKLKLPTLQFNIGQKQLNVAGAQ